MPAALSDLAAARRFTRFYSREAELLDEHLLGSGFTLSEARVLFELAKRAGPTAAEIGRDLGLDAGYLSRILKRFETDGLLRRTPSPVDGRQATLALTQAGRDAFAPLDAGSNAAWAQKLDPLLPPRRTELVAAMTAIETCLGGRDDRVADAVELRPHAIGDLGWIARRQGMLYAAEYGWDGTFEALVAEILVGFVRTHDPACERAWIAERAGDILGSVFLVRQSDEVAKLRLLYVEPAARGLGLGARLVGACIGFARERGYRELTLWTNDCLVAARAIYLKAGFRLVEEERHHSFGVDLVGQNWSLTL